MNKQTALQYAQKEAEFLRKRAWDFIYSLEKLEKDLKKSVDADERRSLKIRIQNTRRLLEDYKSEYKTICKEAGIPSEIIGTGIIKNDQSIDLPPLFLVPARDPNFLGRRDKVREFIQRVLQGGAFAICGFKGMGGLGKTEIAKEICHIFHETWKEQSVPEYLTDLLSQRKFFQDGILWIQFHSEGQTPKTLTDELIDFLIEQCPKVDISKKIKEIQGIDNLNDANLDTLAYMLSGKDMLVVLDNVEQNLRTLDYVLERFKGRFTLLITSRIAIPGIKSIDIKALSDKDAEDLFLCYMGNQHPTEEDRNIVQKLCKLLGNYPLLIKIIASQVKADNSKLAELFTKYKKNPVQLLDECNDSLCIDQRHVDVRTCFMMSFNSLDEEHQRVFHHAALFNNPFTVEKLAALLDDMDKDDIFHIVERLERLSLINRLDGKDGQENTYELHPLMREFALDSLMQTVAIEPGRKEEIKTLLKDLQQAEEENTLLKQLKNDRSLVEKAIKAVQYCEQVFDFDSVLHFAQVLDRHLDSLHCWEERLLLNQWATRAAVALQQDYNEGKYRKQCADIEKQKAMFKNKFDFVGRRKELTYFEDKFLFHPKSFILNIHTDGKGGIGKTQLLQQMLKLCRSKYFDTVISSDELIDFYYTEARSKAGIIDQIIKKLGIDHFQNVIRQLKKYHKTKDSSERQYVLDHAVNALRKDYKVFAARSERADKIIILFFDTYEVVQFVDKEKEKKTAERSDFSEWLEKELFPALQSDNTRLVIAGRYPLIDVDSKFVATKALSLFTYEEAVEFLLEYLKVAEFSKDEYQVFLRQFPQAESLLQEFQYSLEGERTAIRIYEFPNGKRKELGEEVWQALQDKILVKQEKDLLEELKVTKEELNRIIELAGNRPIYLALFMDWVHLSSRGEASKLVREAQSLPTEKAQKEFFENKIVEWLWDNEIKRKYIYYMTVAYRRMTAEIMQHLTGDSPEHCQKVLLEDIRHYSFAKHKEDDKKGDVILLHDEMRELIERRWVKRIDPYRKERSKLLNNIIPYYKENFLSPDYSVTDVSCNILGQQKIPEDIIGKVKTTNSLYFTKHAFIEDLRSKCGLTQKELDDYSLTICNAASKEVSQEKREVYFPEYMEYTFMANADDGVQCFCDEFDTAMDDGRSAYLDMLGREAVVCNKKYHASPLNALQIDLRDVQHYIDSDKPEDIEKALERIKEVDKRRQVDKIWKDSLLYDQFTLWEGVAEFWQDNFDKAIELLKKAHRIFINHDQQQDLIYLAENWIGYVYYRKADFAKAETWMKISLEGLIDLLAKEIGDDNKKRRNLQQRIQYSFGNLAMLYRYTGKFTEAIRYAEMQFNIVRNLPRNNKEIFRSLNTLSHVLAIAGRTVDARCYLEEAERIYKEIPDRLLGGRLYSTFCQLSYGTMEFANLLECYRAEDLHKAVENSHGSYAGDYIEYAKKAIQLLEKEPVFHKELADAYFSLGELYMMMPANHPAVQGDKWKLAEESFEEALKSARKSQFQYRVVDTLESLVTLYYFQSQTKGISLEQKKECEDKQKHYQGKIESDWKIRQYPNLAGRYELIQGDIHFDNALEQLKDEYSKADDSTSGFKELLKAFNHYIQSADYKKEFNINRYHLMLRVIYNRLDKLVELTHPLNFPRLESLDYEQQEELRQKPLISRNVLNLLSQNYATIWKTNEDDSESFRKIFNNIGLLEKKAVPEKKIAALKKELKDYEWAGDYWKAVLVNKCLTELYWIKANFSTDIQKKEEALEQLVLHLNLQCRQYRLMGDAFHARRSYERAEKIIQKINNSSLKKGLEGYALLVKGEYCVQRTDFANLLEYLVVDELEAGREKFEKQFQNALQNARELFKKGQELLKQALQDDPWKNQPLPKRDPYEKKLAEAYFMSGELLIFMGEFSKAFDYFEMCMSHIERYVELYHESGHHYRLDDAKQSYLSAFYFSSGKFGSQECKEKYEQELEEKIQAKDYSRPWVAARFRITQGDILFSECYCMEEKLDNDGDSSSYKFRERRTVERKDLVQMFRKYIEACNYKASYNELSFEAGLRVLRRRIEMIPDSESLDILRDIFRHLWQDGDHLREKKEELDSILQLIRLRSLILQHEKASMA